MTRGKVANTHRGNAGSSTGPVLALPLLIARPTVLQDMCKCIDSVAESQLCGTCKFPMEEDCTSISASAKSCTEGERQRGALRLPRLFQASTEQVLLGQESGGSQLSWEGAVGLTHIELPSSVAVLPRETGSHQPS
ncbi:hypothetical protein E2C01_031347 [Portunus trituberculatus]|uniref:Uncharacterized protein n=1 Tax=Portunus trituberculatus TaxID=210409 RepID=A0A5B7EUA2_PORTR|nr:hypothetical protein [Portunus trituberculatus]